MTKPPPSSSSQPNSSSRPSSVLPYKTQNLKELYQIGKKLGQGQFGTTYLCVEKSTGLRYACKTIPKRKLLCKEDYEDVYREIQIMHHLSEHPNVLCAGGELFDRIVQKGHYTERKAAQLIKTIVGVVEACHSLGVMHRDLKPENFLFLNEDEDAALKATDFGLSVFYKPVHLIFPISCRDTFSDVVGSPYYVAPEVLRKYYGPEADVWSAGVILYILLSGVPPFWAVGDLQADPPGALDFESEPWPCISESVAPDRPLDSAVLSRLKQFSAMNKLKKMALRVIAERLSEEEIGGLKELFKMIDTDNSGTITFDELKNGLRRVGSELMESEIRALMDATYGEFIAATVHMNKLEREENLISAFSFFDKDSSGYITIDELQQACRDFGLSDVHLDEMIREIDQNNDGQIDYSEFAAMMRTGNGGIGRKTMRNTLRVNLGDALRAAEK
ncbi:unnamed protein product [Spirodela intermedia]|uniref:non-specific serine/threonine protein kinase n=1 Tax=Spirodela intermedia TaxID=51605 RepID=A0A7I8JE21_SPIIN|nr:unnamed protein product [Spirodela intermedia]CAA6668404.1 unnamed protein product [Spirodela intermedia]